MRKALSVFILLAVTGGGYFLGGVPTSAHTSHTIQPDSTAKAITEGNPPSTTAVSLTITVNPKPESGEEIKVDVGCQDGTATGGGVDYTCNTQTETFSFDPGNVGATVSRTITPAVITRDTVSEANETFTVVLFNARCGGSPCVNEPADVVVTINNDDLAAGTVTVNDVSSPEGNNGETKDMTFTVTLSRPCTVDQGNLTVPYDSHSDTATENTDFTGVASTLTFSPGQVTKSIVVKTIGDNAGEPNETFKLALGPLGGACAPNFDSVEKPTGTSDLTGVGTITDDDGPPGTAVKTACSGNASGDFNGDGRDDLAIGIPGQAVGGLGDAGAVQVIYGSVTAGLADTGKQLFTQDTDGIEGVAEAGDRFGSCLTAGDFNGDGRDDLAVGAPEEDITSTRGSFRDGGLVGVIYGSATGLNVTTPADQIWSQDSPGIGGGAEIGDAFGGALSSGDFNGDGRDDLAVGVPFEDVGSNRDAGTVNVLLGSSAGVAATGDQLWHQNVKNVAGSAETDDLFGAALATGDLDGNGKDDLVVGAPGESVGTASRAGVIQVIRTGASGLSRALDKIWFQANAAVEDLAESSDRFGSALAVGDFDGDGFDDIAVGVPGEDLGTRTDVGAVAVIYSTSTGPATTDDEVWSEADSTKTTGDTPNNGDAFGAALTAGNFNGTGPTDLAIGVPLNDFGGTNAGSVDIVFGVETGLGGTPQHFTQSNLTAAGANGGAEADDEFGSALTNGDYNGDGRDDLAVGVAKEDVAGAENAGAVDVIPGGATGPVLTTDQYFTQDSGTVQASGSQSGDQYGASVG